MLNMPCLYHLAFVVSNNLLEVLFLRVPNSETRTNTQGTWSNPCNNVFILSQSMYVVTQVWDLLYLTLDLSMSYRNKCDSVSFPRYNKRLEPWGMHPSGTNKHTSLKQYTRSVTEFVDSQSRYAVQVYIYVLRDRVRVVKAYGGRVMGEKIRIGGTYKRNNKEQFIMHQVKRKRNKFSYPN